jgi:hypothetical protein
MSKSTSTKRRRQGKARNDKSICPAHKRKIRHPSRKAALQEMYRLKAVARDPNQRPTTAPTGVYKCPSCGDWHLTSRHEGEGTSHASAS